LIFFIARPLICDFVFIFRQDLQDFMDFFSPFPDGKEKAQPRFSLFSLLNSDFYQSSGRLRLFWINERISLLYAVWGQATSPG